jgi:hypothetical protein
VESSAHSKVLPSGVGSDCHCSSPAKTSWYAAAKPVAPIAAAMTSSISYALGQMSASRTGRPSEPMPSGSVVMSRSIVPASAYATTSGGEAR